MIRGESVGDANGDVGAVDAASGAVEGFFAALVAGSRQSTPKKWLNGYGSIPINTIFRAMENSFDGVNPKQSNNVQRFCTTRRD